MPRPRNSAGQNADVDEQRRILERIEQERADHDMAMRMQNELYNLTPVVTPQRIRPQVATRGSRISTRGSVQSSGSRRGRSTGASASSARGNNSSVRGNRSNGRGGGPIRRTATASRGHRAAAPTGRNRAARNNTDGARLTFRGDRVFARQGNQLVDVTANAYFPDDDEDDDYEDDGDDNDDDNDDDEDVLSDGDSDDSDVIEIDDSPRETVRERPTTAAPSSGRGRGRATRVQHQRGRGRRGRQQSPSINGDYFRIILNTILNRNEPIASDSENDQDYEGGESDGENNLTGSDVNDISDDEDGPLRRDENHIQQDMFDEDLAMYNQELGLWHNDDEYRVPPPRVQLQQNGKPIEPDATWGDCTMCSNPPVKPQGCTKCLQILGCADCVHRWYVARLGSEDGPSCPLCRNSWKGRPSVLLMKTISRRMKKEETKNGPSTSTQKCSSTSK